MICSACQSENSENAKFCSSCGGSLPATLSPAQDIPVADLPDGSRSRLLAALKSGAPETFVINESKVGWAVVGLTGAVLGLGLVISQANGYKWQSDDRLSNLLLVIICFVIGWLAVRYLFRWIRVDFKATALINPLYFLRFRFDRIEAISLIGSNAWDAKHHSDSRGNYAGTTFYFRAAGRQHTLKIKAIRVANELILALNRFPALVANLIQNQNSTALYAFDLLYEWRRREESFPRAKVKRPTGLESLVRRVGPTLLVALVGTMTFFLIIVPYNDSCDDDLRWNTATTAATATAYRLYVATRPDGRHSSEANKAVDVLYDRAAANYRTSSGSVGSEGIEAVIKILEYAKATGHYKVAVNFSGVNDIPADIDAGLRSRYGLPRLVPVLPSFTASMNQAREDRILGRISTSFGKVIPGDILQFGAGRGSPRDPVFSVNYVIRDSGELYYPAKQEHIQEADRDWYTGISFAWKFNIVVPGPNTSTFQFSLDSQPARLFEVAYERSSTDAAEFSPVQAYGAMADSAFDDFGSKLLTELSVK
jgi:hypothetical protein